MILLKKKLKEKRESKDSAKSVSDLKEEYEALNSKQVKTTEEQERYNELVSQIREQFPEIVTYYDETTGQLQCHYKFTLIV